MQCIPRSKRMQTSDTFFKETPVETHQEQSTCTQIQCILPSINVCRLVISDVKRLMKQIKLRCWFSAY